MEQAVLKSNERLERVTTHLEAPNEIVVPRQEVTQHFDAMKESICGIADGVAGTGSAHDIHLYRSRPASLIGATKNETDNAHITENKLDLVLHTTLDAHVPLSEAHIQAEEIKRRLRHAYPHLDSVVIHTEPPEL